MSRWAFVVACLLALYVVAIFVVVSRDVVSCHARLANVAEPSGWRTWPKLEELGTFELEHEDGECVGHGIQCGLVDTSLREPDTCPRSGVSLDGYFDGGIYQGVSDLTLWSKDGVTVVSYHDSMRLQGTGQLPRSSDEKFLTAFRREPVFSHPAFRDAPLMWLAWTLALGMIGTGLSMISARRAFLRAVAVGDAAIYKSALRDESGRITFDDGTAPIAPAPSFGNHAAGPVMVRIADIRAGHYRESPRTVTDDVVAGDRDSATTRLAARSTFVLKRAVVCSALLFLAIAIVGAVWAVSQIRLD